MFRNFQKKFSCDKCGSPIKSQRPVLHDLHHRSQQRFLDARGGVQLGMFSPRAAQLTLRSMVGSGCGSLCAARDSIALVLQLSTLRSKNPVRVPVPRVHQLGTLQHSTTNHLCESVSLRQGCVASCCLMLNSPGFAALAPGPSATSALCVKQRHRKGKKATTYRTWVRNAGVVESFMFSAAQRERHRVGQLEAWGRYRRCRRSGNQTIAKGLSCFSMGPQGWRRVRLGVTGATVLRAFACLPYCSMCYHSYQFETLERAQGSGLRAWSALKYFQQ